MICPTRAMTVLVPKHVYVPRPAQSLLPFLYSPASRRSLATSQQRTTTDRRPAQAEKPTASGTSSKNSKPSKAKAPPLKWKSSPRSLDENIPMNQDSGHIPFDTASGTIAQQQGKSGRSTMTDTELDAFTKLFGSLASKDTLTLDSKQTKSHQRRKPVEKKSYVSGLEDEVLGRSPRDEVSLDVQSSIYDIEQIFAEDLAPDVTATLERYPAAIRELAKWAEIQRLREQERHQTNDPTLLKAKAEMRRVEKLLLACKTDQQVWDVMQAEVFGPVAKLVESEASTGKASVPTDKDVKSSIKQKAKRKAKAKTNADSKSEEATTSTSATTQKGSSEPPTLPLLAHTYAPLLLLAVRLLLRRTASSRPSALAPALLHAARALGPTSFALAASTPLYNTLLQNTWRSTAQYSKVFAMLQEMEQAGLVMDRGTLEVLDEMLAFRQAAAQGVLGSAVGAVEEMMASRKADGEQARLWRDKIWEGIKARTMERVRREEAKRALASEEAAETVESLENRPLAVAAAA